MPKGKRVIVIAHGGLAEVMAGTAIIFDMRAVGGLAARL